MGVKRQNRVKIANFAKAAKPVDFLKVSKPARIPGQVRRELRTQSPPSKGQISKSFRGKFSELTAPPNQSRSRAQPKFLGGFNAVKAQSEAAKPGKRKAGIS